jgi:hypothetical protein
MAFKIPTSSSIARPTENYPNLHFWVKNIPSGNTVYNDGAVVFFIHRACFKVEGNVFVFKTDKENFYIVRWCCN